MERNNTILIEYSGSDLRVLCQTETKLGLYRKFRNVKKYHVTLQRVSFDISEVRFETVYGQQQDTW